ncbi:hypothetical protein O9993_09785 [Vibrio lentus]|nr:hypothetical protein [Vibrio lentus]
MRSVRAFKYIASPGLVIKLRSRNYTEQTDIVRILMAKLSNQKQIQLGLDETLRKSEVALMLMFTLVNELTAHGKMLLSLENQGCCKILQPNQPARSNPTS